MAATILDGRAVADELRAAVHERSVRLRARGVIPRLAVVIVGDDEASAAYARALAKTGARVEIEVMIDALPLTTRIAALRARLQRLGADPSIHGIILQQPLPQHLPIAMIADAIPTAKDVDAANPISQGRLAFGSGDVFVPATPAAAMLLIERSPSWPLAGRNAVVVGRSRVVGLPVALLMTARDATVTITHRRTRDLAAVTRSADVLVVATGVPKMITGEMVRPGATVIDVGTSYVDGKLTGDVDFASASDVAGAITPVPGGVGPVTNLALMRNVTDAADRL